MLDAFLLCESKSPAPEPSRVFYASASPLTIFEITGFNSHASSTFYLQFFGATAVPATGATPDYVIQAPALQSFGYQPLGGLFLPAGGGVWACSTTPGTLTLASTNALMVFVKFMPEYV